MLELIFSEVNIALTIFVMVLVTYWLISMIGGLDFDIDFDVDVDVDADIDVDIDTGSGVETGFEDTANVEVNKDDVVGKRRKPLKWWQIVLIYFNFVGLPFMFTFTCFVFFWWISSLVLTSFFDLYETTFGFLIMFLSFIPGLIFTKIFTNPFKSFFSKFNKDGDAPVDFIGRQGISNSTISGDKMGSAEVLIDGNPYSIYIKSENGETINYHDQILIIKASEGNTYYYVQHYNF
jgi:hypothetical protein